MIKTNFEKVYRKGWLKSRDSIWHESDRFTAGQKLYFSYEKSHDFSVGTIDPMKLYVDYQRRHDMLSGNIAAREEFLQAYKAIPIVSRPIIDHLILKDMLPPAMEKREISKLKKALCFALDCLICHYLGKNEK